jgi:hypothetical protein
VVLVGATTLCALLVVGVSRCERGAPSLTSDTRSSALDGNAEKVEFLSRYVRYVSAVEAAEFHVRYHDNRAGCGSVPGPSEYFIDAAIKVAPADVPLWVAGLEPLNSGADVDVSWGLALVPPSWGPSPLVAPVVYHATEGPSDSGSILAVFPQEGIVLKRTWAY